MRALETGRWTPYLFIAPMMVGLTVFRFGPLAVAAYTSFTKWDIRTAPEWVGLANYRELWGSDLFWQVVRNSILFSVIFVPGVMVCSLALAVLLNRKARGIAFFRAAYFLPWITTMVAVAFVWRWIFTPRFGILNHFLTTYVGVDDPPAWLAETRWALPALAVVSIWKALGFQMMIFLAGLQSIPGELYEAAELDGASRWQQFREVTFPMLSPVTFFVFIITFIDSFKTFEVTFALTGGGPNNSSETLAFSIFRNAFRFGRMGFASAQAMILMAAVSALAAISFWLQARTTRRALGQ